MSISNTMLTMSRRRLVLQQTKNRNYGNDDDRLSCQLPVHRSSEQIARALVPHLFGELLTSSRATLVKTPLRSAYVRVFTVHCRANVCIEHQSDAKEQNQVKVGERNHGHRRPNRGRREKKTRGSRRRGRPGCLHPQDPSSRHAQRVKNPAVHRHLILFNSLLMLGPVELQPAAYHARSWT